MAAVDRQKRAVVLRLCPACSRRVNQQVSATCPICAGMGVLRLGRPALLRYPAEVVAKAVEYALELDAQRSLAARPVNLPAARAALTSMVGKLKRSGLLADLELGKNPATTELVSNNVSAAASHQQARVLAAEAAGLPYAEGTAAILQAPAVKYDPASLPVDGILIGFGSAGFLAGLTQVADPVDSLEIQHRNQAVLDRQGEVLGRAAQSRH